MTRTIARQIAVRICFSEDFLNDTPDSIINDFFDEEHYKSLKEDDEIFRSIPGEREMEYIRKLITKVYEHSAEIDSMISSFSEKRKLERIPKTALSILRCAVCEMMYFDDIPASVTINEAVEIAKMFDSPETVSFVNGLLGSVNKALSEG